MWKLLEILLYYLPTVLNWRKVRAIRVVKVVIRVVITPPLCYNMVGRASAMLEAL
jgi:hypothetical protein